MLSISMSQPYARYLAAPSENHFFGIVVNEALPNLFEKLMLPFIRSEIKTLDISKFKSLLKAEILF